MSRPYPVTRSTKQRLGRFTVVMDTILTGGGEAPYSYIREPDFVCVLPLAGEDIVYIRQYRHAVDAWKLEFPGGVLDPSETPEEAAGRELLEETGYRAESLTGLGWIHAKAGSSTAKAYLYLARCVMESPQALDPAERIEVLRCPWDEFQAMVDSGAFDQVYGLVAWQRGIRQIEGKGREGR